MQTAHQGNRKKFELEKWSSFLLEAFVIQLLRQKKSPLFREIHMPGGPLYGKLLCGQGRRIGLAQVLAFIAVWEDPLPRTIPAQILLAGTSSTTSC